jgi:hypothetical protein
MNYKIFLRDRNFIPYGNKNCSKHIDYPNLIWNSDNSYTDDDYVVFTDGCLTDELIRNNGRDIAWMVEPHDIYSESYNYIEKNHEKFYKILTHDSKFLNYKNSIFIPFGGCFLEEQHRKIHNKNKMVSMICSGKKMTNGHLFRNKCASEFNRRIDVFGYAYNQIESLSTSLNDYRFQVVVENSWVDYWFTEKLIVCFLTGTIPIYKGCVNINKFFDLNGIITFDTVDQLDEILNKLDESIYSNKIESVINNYNICKKYLLPEYSIYKNLLLCDNNFDKYLI